MADHPTVAHGPQEAAVAEVSVDPDVVAQVGDGPCGPLGDVAAYVGPGLGEHPGQVTGLVDGQRVPVGVPECEPLRAPAEGDVVLEVHDLALGVGQPHAVAHGGAEDVRIRAS